MSTHFFCFFPGKIADVDLTVGHFDCIVSQKLLATNCLILLLNS